MFPKEYQNPPFEFSDTRWNEEDQCEEYVHSDMQLRIEAKTLMIAQNDPENSPRKTDEIERTLGHVVFELAYRTRTLDEYIRFHKEAVDLKAA